MEKEQRETRKKEAPASVWATLSSINVNEHVEQKNGLTYLSWAWAWQKVKENFPSAFYTIYERADGCPYWTDGATCWVKTGVTIEGLEHIEYLPVMDNRNHSIPLKGMTSMDMNKAIQRSLTKACARHGLGIYIYAGEDLPEAEVLANKQEEAVQLGEACEKIRACISIEAMKEVYEEYPQFANNKVFRATINNRNKELRESQMFNN